MLFTKCWRFILLSSDVFLSINTVTTHTPFHVKVYCCRSINFHKYCSIHTGRVPLLTKLLGLHCTPFYLGSSSSFQKKLFKTMYTSQLFSTSNRMASTNFVFSWNLDGKFFTISLKLCCIHTLCCHATKSGTI